MSNVVLIGMSGSGKSTVGQALADRMGWNFANADSLVESREGLSIQELFQKGEEFFRDAESRALQDLSRLDNWVIATGGGAVKRRANMEMLEKSGVLIYLFRPLELILQNQDLSDRPLLASDVEKRLGELYEERRGLYEKATISG